MKTMYRAIVNSPITELLFNIDSNQKEIIVADTNKLPPAPNLATIGTDENAETILYLEKSDTSLLNVIRGFQGNAQSWLSGVPVSRMFTEYDHNAFIDNIAEVKEQIEVHEDRKDNPHEVTVEQIGGISEEKFLHLDLNVIDIAIELETLKNAILNGVTANIFIETFQNLDDISVLDGVYDQERKVVYA